MWPFSARKEKSVHTETPEEHTLRVRNTNRAALDRMNRILSIYLTDVDRFYQEYKGQGIALAATAAAINSVVLDQRVSELERKVTKLIESHSTPTGPKSPLWNGEWPPADDNKSRKRIIALRRTNRR